MQAMHGRLSAPIHYQALQHFVTHSPWPDQPLWDRLSEVRGGILAIDGTGAETGKHSVGVKRQYSGTLGKTGNCQVAVSSLLTAGRSSAKSNAYVKEPGFIVLDAGDLADSSGVNQSPHCLQRPLRTASRLPS